MRRRRTWCSLYYPSIYSRLSSLLHPRAWLHSNGFVSGGFPKRPGTSVRGKLLGMGLAVHLSRPPSPLFLVCLPHFAAGLFGRWDKIRRENLLCGQSCNQPARSEWFRLVRGFWLMVPWQFGVILHLMLTCPCKAGSFCVALEKKKGCLRLSFGPWFCSWFARD